MLIPPKFEQRASTRQPEYIQEINKLLVAQHDRICRNRSLTLRSSHHRGWRNVSFCKKCEICSYSGTVDQEK